MDRTSHNESLIICTALKIMTVFEDINIAKLDVLLIICVDHAIRKRLIGYDTYNDFIQSESRFEMALNRKFLEYQPCILNALTMMLMCGIIESNDSELMQLSKKGYEMAWGSVNIKNDVTESIFEAVLHCRTFIDSVSYSQIYKDLGIIL